MSRPFGIQTIDIVNIFDRLTPDDASVEAGQLDPSVLTPVVEIDPQWVGIEPIMHIVSAGAPGAINGANVTVSDADAATSSANMGHTVDTSKNRFYYHLGTYVGGGTVSPIIMRIQIGMLGGASSIGDWSCVNDANGRLNAAGGFFVPAGGELEVRNLTQGGAGDTFQITYLGFQADPGVPLPTTSGPFFHTGP